MQRFLRRYRDLLPVIAGCSILLLAYTGALPVSAATTKIDPACAGHGCDGSDPYTTMCAGQLFDHEYLVLSSAIELAGQMWGTVQLWYSPLCRTSWARTVASTPHILQSATLTLLSATQPYTRTAWNGHEVISPQAFAPVPVVQASGEILHAGRLASGCVSLLPHRLRPC